MVLLFSELNEASPSLASLSDLVNFSTKFYNLYLDYYSLISITEQLIEIHILSFKL